MTKGDKQSIARVFNNKYQNRQLEKSNERTIYKLLNLLFSWQLNDFGAILIRTVLLWNQIKEKFYAAIYLVDQTPENAVQTSLIRCIQMFSPVSFICIRLENGAIFFDLEHSLPWY